jgi:glutamyl-tRNA reductase
MTLRMVGCSHHRAPLVVRERLVFTVHQTEEALSQWRRAYPDTEAVLVSTCNRVELYTATRCGNVGPDYGGIVDFLARFHHLPPQSCCDAFLEQQGPDAVRHLFQVASSLDSMVLGETQILGQVKQAYRLAARQQSTGPVTHRAFQAAVRVAGRISTETALHQKRVSVASVAIGDYATQIFERFDDKQVVVLGAGEIAEETLRYLRERGARKITLVNRSAQRGSELADRWEGNYRPWQERLESLRQADLVISATGGKHPIVTSSDYASRVEPYRDGKPLMILDLAVPRDIEPSVGDRLGVYLYSLDDLSAACQRNREHRNKEWAAASQIVDEETDRFMAHLHHRATAPVITQLRQGWEKPKEQELRRLWNRLPDLDERSREEISRAFDRLVNKLLHRPLESIRDEAQSGVPDGLLDALKRLFQLKD